MASMPGSAADLLPFRARAGETGNTKRLARATIPIKAAPRQGVRSCGRDSRRPAPHRKGERRAGTALCPRAWLFSPPPRPGPRPPSTSADRARSSTWSMLKLAGVWRGGNASNVLRSSPTMAWAVTSGNARSINHRSEDMLPSTSSRSNGSRRADRAADDQARDRRPAPGRRRGRRRQREPTGLRVRGRAPPGLASEEAPPGFPQYGRPGVALNRQVAGVTAAGGPRGVLTAP
jgi:hypothetical protein